MAAQKLGSIIESSPGPRNLSLNELARRTDIDKGVLSRIEMAKRLSRRDCNLGKTCRSIGYNFLFLLTATNKAQSRGQDPSRTPRCR